MDSYEIEIPESINTGVLVQELNGYKCLVPDDPFIDLEYFSGGYCQTYPLEKKGAPKRCLRLWFDFGKISKEDLNYVKKKASFFSNNSIQYVIPYRYYDRALKLNNGIEIPGMVMDWVEGDKLIDYIREHCREPRLMKSLSENFYNMVSYLNSKGISHGDLSGDNIIVRTDGSLCLIDYDSFFVPGLENVRQPLRGTGGYQHPERLNGDNLFLSGTMDYFSQQVIYLSILATAKQPDFIRYFGDKELLFSGTDLKNLTCFQQSRGYKALAAMNEYVITTLLNELEYAISSPLNKVKSIVEIISAESSATEQIKHSIVIKQPKQGLLLAYPPQAVAGEVVTVRCNNNKPEEYELKGINVFTSDGVWRLGNQRSFKMPDSDVILEAEFEEISHGFKELNYCSKCGTQYYKSYSRYCHHCGTKRK